MDYDYAHTSLNSRKRIYANAFSHQGPSSAFKAPRPSAPVVRAAINVIQRANRHPNSVLRSYAQRRSRPVFRRAPPRSSRVRVRAPYRRRATIRRRRY